jgi:hypothetical protein
MDGYKPLIGQKKDIGTLQIFYQSSDAVKQYATNLNGEYNLRLVDLKFIGDGAAGSNYAFEVSSSSLRLGQSNVNNTFKFVYRDGVNEISNPIPFYDISIKNWLDINFIRLGSVGSALPANFNIILTFEYERL